ncbi:MAG: hypothetical protein HC827_01235 [Cyanobacteria bacterium RM1_2_2]|nr:hypothetical protein [Cyanobacteria bacterium RM1_2_2]
MNNAYYGSEVSIAMPASEADLIKLLRRHTLESSKTKPQVEPIDNLS